MRELYSIAFRLACSCASHSLQRPLNVLPYFHPCIASGQALVCRRTFSPEPGKKSFSNGITSSCRSSVFLAGELPVTHIPRSFFPRRPVFPRTYGSEEPSPPPPTLRSVFFSIRTSFQLQGSPPQNCSLPHSNAFPYVL